MENLKEITKTLVNEGIFVSIKYDSFKDMFYVDLETQAKSHLYLYEDGSLEGRYGYKTSVDLNDNIEDILRTLCIEFKQSLCGRDYYNGAWAKLSAKIFGK